MDEELNSSPSSSDRLCCDRKWIPRTDLIELQDEFESGLTDTEPAGCYTRCLQRGAGACGGVCFKLVTG